MDMTDQQFAQMLRDDRLTQVICALIARRVTATSVVIGGTDRSSAAALAADAKAIIAALVK